MSICHLQLTVISLTCLVGVYASPGTENGPVQWAHLIHSALSVFHEVGGKFILRNLCIFNFVMTDIFQNFFQSLNVVLVETSSCVNVGR
jgi:hypothetical protein